VCALRATGRVGSHVGPARSENKISAEITTTIRQCHKMSHFRAMISLVSEAAGQADGSGCDALNSRLTLAVTFACGSHDFREV
jgi:hypothetical protein